MNQVLINTILSVKDMGYRVDALEYGFKSVKKAFKSQSITNFGVFCILLGGIYIIKDHEKKIKELNSRLNKMEYELAAQKMRADHINKNEGIDDFREI